jgi:hypothetical protein
MFGAYKFRDQIAQQDCGFLGAFMVNSVSSSYFTGGANVSTSQVLGSTNNFHKLIYRLYVPNYGQSAASSWTHSSTYLYLASPNSSYNPGTGVSSSLSSVLSVASNWTLIDSLNCVASFSNTGSSASSSTYVAAIDLRPEKFPYTLLAQNYITPVVYITSGSNAMSTPAALICDAYLTDYEPASNFDAATVATAETDYL